MDAFIVKNLEDTLINPEYTKWNPSSIAAVYTAAIGCHGDRAKELGNIILSNYLAWAETQTIEDSFFGPPSAQFASEVIKSKDKAIASGINYRIDPLSFRVTPEPDDYPTERYLFSLHVSNMTDREFYNNSTETTG